MAETAVLAAMAQLAPLLVEKVQLLGGVRQEVVQIKEDMESIRAFLKDADKRQHTDQSINTWVNQIRRVANDLELVVDKFLFQIERTNVIRQLMVRSRIANEIGSIRARLRAICDRRRDLALAPSLHEVASSSTHDPRLTVPLFIEESEIVGIDEPRDCVIKLLKDGEDPRKVISVLGMGGIGKTTLARKVYEDQAIRSHFMCYAWATVSKTYSQEELLKNMMVELMQASGQMSLCGDIGTMDYLQRLKTARAFLQNKRYFIVLDDVWTTIDWENLKHAFPNNQLQSRIIITTRMHEVASYCSISPLNVYMLRPLSMEDAWALFCMKAFDGVCPLGLEKSSKEILKICGGLPLAIVTIGGLLLTKKRNFNEWNKVHGYLNLEMNQEDGMLKKMTKILWLSYDDLPYQLRSCFLYFGIYPEDYSIKRGQLIREWIAEGFIEPGEAGMTLEEIAEGYLNELVHRSLVEVVQFNSYGRVNKCCVHDVIRELILSKSKEQNFLCLVGIDRDHLDDSVHRLSVTSGMISALDMKKLPKLRSLFMFTTCELSALRNFKMLKVLNLNGVPLKHFPCEIFNLLYLKYLNMRNTDIMEIPKSIRKLKNLQTLDLKHTFVSQLPTGILKLLDIRHIMVYHFDFEGTVSTANGVKMPLRIGNLKYLQKLATLRLDGSDDQARELGELTQLRTLGISSIKGQDWSILRSSITKMKYLEALWINTSVNDEPLDVQFLSTLSPKLRSIILRGQLKELPILSGSFMSLVKIALISSKLHCNILHTFGELPNLTYLAIENAYDGEGLRSAEGSFKRLRRLIIKALSRLNSVYIDKGAMPELEELRIIECPNLHVVPRGIEHLKTLKELNLGEMPEEFIKKIRRDQGKDRDKVNHISSMWHLYKINGMWRTECLS